MCAVVGMFATASVSPLCATPPVRSASHSANWFATGMNVGFGRSGSCSVRSRTPPRMLRARSAIALSSDCMTSTMIVRRDQPRGQVSFSEADRVARHRAEQLQRPRELRPVARRAA